MNLNQIKTADLRKMAEDQKIEGYEDLEREDLIKALKPKEKPKEEPEEKEEVDLDGLTMKKLQKVAKEKEINIKGLKKKADVIKAIKEGKKEEKEPEVPEEPEEEETPVGITESRTPVGSKAERMKAKLAKQPKVTILIPLEKGENPRSTFPVTLNSFRLNIRKGIYVKVPEQVARIIMNSQKQTVAALTGGLNLDNPNHPKRKSGMGVKDLD